MVVATGNFQLPRYIFESGYVEVSYDGTTFETVGELECGKYTIYPKSPIRAVRMVCTSQGNGAEWVSIQPPTIYPLL
jgi:hexosaminidase